MHASSIFLHLKQHGQLLDSEIAAATGIALHEVHDSISKLVEQGEISRCRVTRFNQGIAVEGIQCRIRGFSPVSKSRGIWHKVKVTATISTIFGLASLNLATLANDTAHSAAFGGLE